MADSVYRHRKTTLESVEPRRQTPVTAALLSVVKKTGINGFFCSLGQRTAAGGVQQIWVSYE